MTKSIADEIAALRRELERHNRLYYVEAAPEISDREFDRLMQRLRELETQYPEYDSEDSPTRKVGGEPIAGFQTVKHRVPMLSIENIFEEQQIIDWDVGLQKVLNTDSPDYTLEYKIDGVAIGLIYENGQLVRGVTRGNGQTGDDITSNVRVIAGVPLRLDCDSPPARLEIRGEAMIHGEDFAAFQEAQIERGEEPLRNPRNAAAGALKLLDPKQARQRRLRFLTHGVGYTQGIQGETWLSLLHVIRRLGVPVTPHVTLARGIRQLLRGITEMIDGVPELPFEVDGIVIKLNALQEREALGATSKSPRWVRAYKWERYEAETTVRNIVVQVGKTGVLTPVAELEPVEIDGTIVSRASLHNRDELNRLEVRIGDSILVEKAGKIIPHVLRVNTAARTGREVSFAFPQSCPECGTETCQEEGSVYIRCPNPQCPAQLRETIVFFASRSAMDIDGLGEKLVEQLLSAGLIAGLPSLYRLDQHRDRLVNLERIGEKLADRLLAGIAASRNQPLWRLLTGMNIRHVGQNNAKVLEAAFGTMDAIAAQSVKQLATVDEVGPVIAESVHSFFASECGRRLVSEFHELKLNLGTPLTQPAEAAGGVFSGKTLVVTGALDGLSRDEARQLIREHGGRTAGSVSKNTDFVVAGAKTGSKLTKAQELGIQVLTEGEFMALLQDHS